MTIHLTPQLIEFRRRLMQLDREEILEIIRLQDPQYIEHIRRIEYVFKYKLRHLNWQDGSPVEGKQLTKEELVRLVDPPFMFDKTLAEAGFDEKMQRYAHIASDPVLFAKHFLEDQPRAYQTMILRDENPRKVMRFGRRLGKTATMAFYCLWFCYTMADAKVLVVAPMKSHVGLIFDEIIRLAKQNELILSPDEKNCAITRYVKSPHHEIVFENGATIRFFSTGMKSNNKTDVARGQEADVIICDEMDYMGEDDLVALLAMLQNTNERKRVRKTLIGASTPSGQRNTFWDWNTDPTFKFSAYWFPSYVNPNWDQETEDMMHVDYDSETAYRHEIEADWGEDEQGVYPAKYVQLAARTPGWDYIINPLYGQGQSFFVFGVDWDKFGAGVNVVVLEVCNDRYPDEEYRGKVRLAFREEISKGDFTYLGAMERIAELAMLYNPRHIYVDRGAGEVQIEMFKQHGMAHPQTGLHKIVKGVQFSESIQVVDPFTKQEVKRDVKTFMIDTLYKMLERQLFTFPSHDEKLYLQLISYVVVRVSIHGRQIFGPGGNTVDHAHDALILACYAIADNYDELLNPIYTNTSYSIKNDVFLPTFSIDTKEDQEIANEKWGGNHGPVQLRRAFTGVRRAGGNRGMIKRKMF